jgi:hypothetical protein
MMPAQRAFRRGRHVLVTRHIGANGSCLSLMRTPRRPGFHLQDLLTFALLRPWSRLDRHTSAEQIVSISPRRNWCNEVIDVRRRLFAERARLICYRHFAAPIEMTENLPRALNFGLPPGNSLPVHAVVAGFGYALGRAIEWTQMNNPLPEQPSLLLDAIAGQTLGWQSRRNAQQIAETLGWYSSKQIGTPMRPASLFAIDKEIAA